MTYRDDMEDLFEVWRNVDTSKEASIDGEYRTRRLKKDTGLMKKA